VSKDLTAEGVRDLVGRSPVILEIGCNDGTDTLAFLGAMPEARIYCFEPDPRAIARFKRQVHDPRARLFLMGVSNQDGTATFYGSSGQAPETSKHPGAPACCWLDEWDLSGSLCRPTGHLSYSPWVTFPESRQCLVRTIKLDTWAAHHLNADCIDFIWCDVQGAEALVIQGGAKTLSITRYFYTEFYNTPLYEGQLPLGDLQGMLPDFTLLGTYGDNALFKNRRPECFKSPS
jgi:FkbM family methyltransferase